MAEDRTELAPDEIELKTFPVTLRGFDQAEVTRFLQAVAAQQRATLERAESVRAAEAEAEAEALLSLASKMWEEASLAFKSALDEAARIRTNALALSERTLAQAVEDGEAIRRAATSEIESWRRQSAS